MEGSGENPVILDVGNLLTKVGLCELEKTSPDHIFPSQESDIFPDKFDEHSSLISDSTVTNWDRFEDIMQHAIGITSKKKSSDHPLVLVEKPGLDRHCRQKMVQLAFEGLEVPYFYLGSEPTMALYSVGLSAGIVLSSGHESSHVSTIHDGHRPPYGLVPLGFGGKDVTSYTADIVKDMLGKEFSTDEAENFKCRNGHFYAEETPCNPGSEKKEEIGQKIAEYVLHPKGDCYGFHEAITRSIRLTDEEDDYEPVYFRNIMLCGGNTLFSGIKEKLEMEIKTPDYLTCGVRVIAPSFRQHAAWVGGSVAASLPTFKTFWITEEDYCEYGENILCRKCLPY
ncbi:actin-like [Lytechinus pictus]|uniref:actin-like n=1 Tax=Lytechinus pictus TaxID=7653 RepID=UPI0030B9C5B2